MASRLTTYIALVITVLIIRFPSPCPMPSRFGVDGGEGAPLGGWRRFAHVTSPTYVQNN